MTDQPPPQPDFLAPHSIQAEEAVLGAILINPEALPDMEFLKADDFFILRHSWIWEAMTRLNERGEAIDNLTVINELKALRHLEDTGGGAYITYLINNCPTSLHAEVYARIVERAAIRRRLLEAAGRIAQLASQDDTDINQVVDQSEATLFRVTRSVDSGALVTFQDAALRHWEMINQVWQTGIVPGVKCGFTDIDQTTGGFKKGEFILVAGRPGMGKTSLLLGILSNLVKANLRVMLFSLEMSLEQNIGRLVAMEGYLSTPTAMTGNMDGKQKEIYNDTIGMVGQWRGAIDDTPAITVSYVARQARRAIRRVGGLDLILIDHLGLMKGMGKPQNRVQEVGSISRGLKELARELELPILAACQLSRAVEQRSDKRPVLSDLRETGDLEQDADVVMFIYRPEVYDEDTLRPNQADINIAKQRNGPLATVPLYFKKEHSAFANLVRKEPDLSGY